MARICFPSITGSPVPDSVEVWPILGGIQLAAEVDAPARPDRLDAGTDNATADDDLEVECGCESPAPPGSRR